MAMMINQVRFSFPKFLLDNKGTSKLGENLKGPLMTVYCNPR